MGSFAEGQLLTRNAQKLTGRFRHQKPNGRKLPSLKKFCRSANDPISVIGSCLIKRTITEDSELDEDCSNGVRTK